MTELTPESAGPLRLFAKALEGMTFSEIGALAEFMDSLTLSTFAAAFHGETRARGEGEKTKRDWK